MILLDLLLLILYVNHNSLPHMQTVPINIHAEKWEILLEFLIRVQFVKIFDLFDIVARRTVVFQFFLDILTAYMDLIFLLLLCFLLSLFGLLLCLFSLLL